MALTYNKGEVKTRSNIYQRFETGDVATAQAVDGNVGVVIRSTWGDVDRATKLTSPNQIKEAFGDGGTTDILNQIFSAGATTVYVARLDGEDGKAGSATIVGEGGTVELELKNIGSRNIRLQIKPDITVENRQIVNILNEDGEILETYHYATGEGEDEIDNFVECIASSSVVTVTKVNKDARKLSPSKTTDTAGTDTDTGVSAKVTNNENRLDVVFTGLGDTYEPAIRLKSQNGAILAFSEKSIQLVEDGDKLSIIFTPNAPANGTFTLEIRVKEKSSGTYKTIQNSSFTVAVEDLTDKNTVIPSVATLEFEGGVDPTITNLSYSNAFEKLDRYRFNTLCLDTVTESVVDLAVDFTQRLYENGRYTILIAGTPSSNTLQDSINKAKAINKRNVVLVDRGYINASGVAIDEAMVAAQIAGLVAATSSTVSNTGDVLDGSVSLIRSYSNDEYEDAISGGLLTLSLNDNDQVVIESAITTLTELEDGIEDKGWMKIKRSKVRNEMFSRITQALAGKGPKTPPDDNGEGYIRGLILDVLKEMAAERKIAPNYTVIPTEEIDEPDSISYQLQVYDYDTLEKIYLDYVFSYRNNQQ